MINYSHQAYYFKGVRSMDSILFALIINKR